MSSPALKGRDFQAYRASHPVSTVVGAALAVTLPLGEYDKDKLLNLGHNRFAITSQLGLIHTRGPWSSEVTGSISFYTNNSDFLVDYTRAVQRKSIPSPRAAMILPDMHQLQGALSRFSVRLALNDRSEPIEYSILKRV